jgi:hypothetical protein
VARPALFRLVLVAGVIVLAAATWVRADTETRLRLVVDAEQTVDPAVRAHAIGEATRIWHQYGVSLVTDDAAGCTDASDAVLRVTIGLGRDSTSGDAGLGAIEFASDGTPGSAIVLNYDAVTRIATSAPVMGLHPALWPAGLRDEIIARALGRALAHEIGHYLLRSPLHARSGLMKARQQGAALGSPNDRPFELTEPDRARLRLVLAAPSECPLIATR